MSINLACRICGNSSSKVFNGLLFEKVVTYYDCIHCGYVQTETPTWLGRAYAEAINESDTGIMARNQVNARIVLATLFALGKVDTTCVDYAAGYGIQVRLLRDYGINALWSDRYCQNLMARGFEYANEKVALVTAFEAFEHFVNPAEELDKMLAIAPCVLFSTEVIADPAPKQDDWWYYGKEHGQHIGFFRTRTLEKLARDRGKNFLTNGSSYHLISDRPVNQTLWKLMVKGNRLMPYLLRRRLKSLTWLDHELIASRK